MISEDNRKVLDKLLTEYNKLSFSEKLFYPGGLIIALELHQRERSSISAFTVCNVYLNEVWGGQWLFFCSLNCFSFSGLILSIKTLNSVSLFTDVTAQANEEMFAWLSKESDTSLKIRAAKRCFLRLNSRIESYTDSVSQVSTQQLLALTWLAFNITCNDYVI